MKFITPYVIAVGVFYQMNSCGMDVSRECNKEDNKRLLLHAETDLIAEIMKLKTAVANLTSGSSAEILKLKSAIANLTSDNIALKTQVTTLQSKVAQLEKSDVAAVQASVGKLEQGLSNTLTGLRNLSQEIKGSMYTRWGRNMCANDSELVYRGYLAGKYYSNSGSGTDHLCLPNDPTYVGEL